MGAQLSKYSTLPSSCQIQPTPPEGVKLGGHCWIAGDDKGQVTTCAITRAKGRILTDVQLEAATDDSHQFLDEGLIVSFLVVRTAASSSTSDCMG